LKKGTKIIDNFKVTRWNIRDKTHEEVRSARGMLHGLNGKSLPPREIRFTVVKGGAFLSKEKGGGHYVWVRARCGLGVFWARGKRRKKTKNMKRLLKRSFN